VSTGTGFAPIWSIAHAIALGEPSRPVALVIGARDPRDLYMVQALRWLVDRGIENIRLTATGMRVSPDIGFGRVTEFLPDDLSATDTVYVAGAPEMVAAVKTVARMAGAECFADPFLPSSHGLKLRDRLARIAQSRPLADLVVNPFSPRPLRSVAIPAARPGRVARAMAPQASGFAGLVGKLIGRI
jgi:3-phenylpropionate/trans-cinnamate dioxygenase ferredoxin reductase subunit